MAAETIAKRLSDQARRMPEEPAINIRVGNTWRTVNWTQYDRDAKNVSRALVAMGLEKGDAITILGGSVYQWLLSAIGSANVGVMPAGIYHTSSPEEIAYVAQHCKSRIMVVQTPEQLARVKAEWANMPDLAHVVLIQGEDSDDRVMTWDAFIAQGKDITDAELDSRVQQITEDDVGSLIYTSGTTGNPKAVMLTHRNLEFAAQSFTKYFESEPGEILLSYLPLAHVAEQINTIHNGITMGYSIYMCDEPLKLAEYLAAVRPTTFFGVPRVWERFYTALNARFAAATGTKAKIANWARDIGREVSQTRMEGRAPGAVLAFKFKLADKLVFSKVKQAIGLDRCKFYATGSAPTPDAVMDLFNSLGINLMELYGQTEGVALTALNSRQSFRIGTVGKVPNGVEVKIAEDGEILFKGPNVFKGYLHNEEATAETIVDGWVHSGDLGEFDQDGFLKIVGRKKDIIITSGGKNIAPKNIEGSLMALGLVGQAVLIGDNQRYLIALLTLDEAAQAAFAKEHGVSVEDVYKSDKLREALEQQIRDQVNPHFSRAEHVRNFTVLPKQFTPEAGETTVTFKIKRPVIHKKYASIIDEVYENGQAL